MKICAKTLLNLNNFRKSRKFCDVVLISNDGHTFYAHKNILASCSSFFEKCFVTAGSADEIEFDEYSTEELSIMLACFYDEIDVKSEKPLSFNTLVRIISLANFFLSDQLLELCQNTLSNCFLCVGNSLKSLFICQENFSTDVTKKFRLFVLQNFYKILEIEYREMIAEIGDTQLYDLLSDDALNVIEEFDVFLCIKSWVEFDCAKRKKFLSKLITCVRLEFIGKVKQLSEIFTFSTVYDDVTFNLNFLNCPDKRYRLPSDVIFVMCGDAEGYPVNIVEVYNTKSEKFSSWFPEHCLPRMNFGMAEMDNKIYLIGGFVNTHSSNNVVRFDPSTKQFKTLSSMIVSRSYVAVAALNGYIFACGGHDGRDRLGSVEKYNVHDNQWSYVKSMNSIRSDASAAAMNGYIYVAGGYNPESGCLRSVERYDPIIDCWQVLEFMTEPRLGLTLVCSSDRYIFAIGGYPGGDERTKTVEKYDCRWNRWEYVADMSIPRSNVAATVLDGNVYCLGGFDGIYSLNIVERYDIDANEWKVLEPLKYKRSGLCACVVKVGDNVKEFLAIDNGGK